MNHKTIWHVGGLTNFNYGDCVLQSSMKKIVRDRYSGFIDFIHIDTQKTKFSKSIINKMNKEADMLLIGGGGFVFNVPNNSSGWQLDIAQEDIKHIKIPIVVYGIGNNKFPYDCGGFRCDMWDNVAEIISRSQQFSVRNRGTLESIKNAGIDTDKVEIVPDAAVFADSFCASGIQYGGNFKIGLNIATDRWTHRFGDEVRAKYFVDSVLDTLLRVCKNFDATVFLIEHLNPSEMNERNKQYIKQKSLEILGCNLYTVSENNKDLYPPFGYMSGFIADVYKNMDITVGMRGHANIISFGQNTPCIGIGEHNKVKWFLEEVGMSDFLVQSPDEDSEKFYETIINTKDNILKVKANMLNKKMVLNNIKDKFIDRTVSIL